MKCSICGNELPNDSEYCQYCGKKLIAGRLNVSEPLRDKANISADDKVSRMIVKPIQLCDEERSAKIPFDKGSESNMQGENGLESYRKNCSSCGKRRFQLNRIVVLTIAICVILVSLIGLNVFQYFRYNHMHSLNEAKISEADKQIETLKNDLSKTEVKADYYDNICDFLRFGNIGYASDNFRASESIILLDRCDSAKKIVLTAYWYGNGNVSLSNSSPLTATIDFDNNSWTRTTTMTIKPYLEGISIISFSNDVDARTFKIMIIVT